MATKNWPVSQLAFGTRDSVGLLTAMDYRKVILDTQSVKQKLTNKKVRMMSKLLALFLTILILLPFKAEAVAGNWQRDGSVDARLISGLDAVGLKKTIPLGLEVHLEPGWHTYWRSPGALGLPPQIDWTNSLTDQANLKAATLLYPAPKRYLDQGSDTIGYQSRVVFPIDAEVRRPGVPLDIDATVNLLACSTLCVPKTFHLRLYVPHDNAIEGPEADILNPSRALVPTRDTAKAGMAIKSITNNGSSLRFEITSQSTIIAPDIFIESNPEIPFSEPEWKPASDQLSATLTVKPTDPKQDIAALGGTPLVLTLIDGDRSLEAEAEIPEIPGANDHNPLHAFRTALLLAILGGFLLNLMPCVLPVLSLKILSFIGHGGGEAVAVRRSFLVTAAGILFSFFVLALFTLLLKQLGMTLGWGVQFQQPLFLIFLILLLTVFAANMWGLLEVNLPSFIANKLSDHHPKMAGDFATGALATLLATPCTAPFMGTAIGFALASGTSQQILAIFMALGFGMVIPYFSIAIFPDVAIFLPKPGAWMLRLRFVLGVALALTAAWLMWVLSAQLMPIYAITIAVCMVGIISLLGIYSAGYAPLLSKIGIIGFVAIAITLTMGGAPPADPDGKLEAKQLWQKFEQTSIPIQVAAGKTVFVDITADWCLTCKANKKFVLSNKDISQRILHSDVVPMQGDWTTPDDQITNFLHKYKRYGIPFNVVFGPGAPNGITLPEILTHDIVMEALDKASTR